MPGSVGLSVEESVREIILIGRNEGLGSARALAQKRLRLTSRFVFIPRAFHLGKGQSTRNLWHSLAAFQPPEGYKGHRYEVTCLGLGKAAGLVLSP